VFVGDRQLKVIYMGLLRDIRAVSYNKFWSLRIRNCYTRATVMNIHVIICSHQK